jgi:hypothetical protein
MPRPMQHPRQAPRGTACNVACGTLLPLSTSRKHVPVTWPRNYRARPGHGPAAVLAVAGSAPLTSAHRVLRSPSGPAATFILATNAACEPASQRASREAMLLPERDEYRLQRLELGQVLPAHDRTTDCPCRWSLARAAASAAVAMPRRGQYSRAADTPRAFRAWPVPCPRRQARLRLTMQHSGALGSWLRRQ